MFFFTQNKSSDSQNHNSVQELILSVTWTLNIRTFIFVIKECTLKYFPLHFYLQRDCWFSCSIHTPCAGTEMSLAVTSKQRNCVPLTIVKIVQDVPIFPKYSTGTKIPYNSIVKDIKKATVDHKWHLAQTSVSDSSQQWMPRRNKGAQHAHTDTLLDFLPCFQGLVRDRLLEPRWLSLSLLTLNRFFICEPSESVPEALSTSGPYNRLLPRFPQLKHPAWERSTSFRLFWTCHLVVSWHTHLLW